MRFDFLGYCPTKTVDTQIDEPDAVTLQLNSVKPAGRISEAINNVPNNDESTLIYDYNQFENVSNIQHDEKASVFYDTSSVVGSDVEDEILQVRLTKVAGSYNLNNEPKSFQEAINSFEADKWRDAMDAQMVSLVKNKTWVLVKLPSSSQIKPIKCKWVFKKKDNGIYKARLVACGYSQIPNVDFKETYAPVASTTLVRIILSLAAANKMKIAHLDIKTAFLYGDLHETIHMHYPSGYPNPNGFYCKLKKSLYGLKQAPRMWNSKFDSMLKKFNLNQSMIEKCLYYNDDKSLLIGLYVDDGLLAYTCEKQFNDLITYLKNNFEITVDDCAKYLGIEIERKHDGIFIHQSEYIDKLLKRFKMHEANPASTPSDNAKIMADSSSDISESIPFKELVGSLIYLVTCTRPDMAHAVSIASCTAKPTTHH